MDTLEKIIAKAKTAISDNVVPNTAASDTSVPPTVDDLRDQIEHKADEIADDAENVLEDVTEAAQKINWRKVAGYAAAGIAAASAIGAYAYWRSQRRKPLTRAQRLKSQLGLSDVDFHHLRSTINKIDFDQLDKSRRQLGTKLGAYAKQATHKGAKKVAELTR
jgi:hypothetical protein